MKRNVAIGIQDFSTLIENNYFYVDKTSFIKEWWDSGDAVTLITRPRRFGKTLTMSMVEQFFSVDYAKKEEWFEKLAIWKDEKYRDMQGKYPVIFLSFAEVKENSMQQARKKICTIIKRMYDKYDFLLNGDLLSESEKQDYHRISMDMEDSVASYSLKALCHYLQRYYGRKVIVLLDEYDTPMQEAYVHGYWEELAAFTRGLFNSTFKTNPYLERAIMTGITRVSRESMFSDLNNLKIVTTTSDEYADTFGFTEEEVFAAMDEFGYQDKARVKFWYDGFVFGKHKDIYNPWSILNYLDTGKIEPYWANTSSNGLAGKLIREGGKEVKKTFERLLSGEALVTNIDEQIVYDQLDISEAAIWSLLLASGYLKVASYKNYADTALIEDYSDPEYELVLTNFEVKVMFQNIVKRWFDVASSDYNDFIKALLLGDLKAMNIYMNRVSLATFSYFDTGKRPSELVEPERFYHGFVLGLLVDLADKYSILSNRESGFGRYDVLLEPKNKENDAIIMEFKVHDPEDEQSLNDTVKKALEQIDRMQYETILVEKGIERNRIRKYGFAFEGKKVLIG